jgi:hypothetical protein
VSQTHDEVRALRVMVDALRAEPPPELPWDAIEKRLLSGLVGGLLEGSDSPPRGAARVTPLRGTLPARGQAQGLESWSPFARVLGFAAAAAVLAFGVGSMTGESRMPSAAAPARHVIETASVAPALDGAHPAGRPGAPVDGSAARDLSALRPGDIVEAGAAPVTFAQAGLARWTLAPGSALRVSSVGVGHTVTLERGSIRAEVTPRDPAEGLVEAFAVEVAGTRVAVHGTAFSVEIQGPRLIVDVEHGAVAVGPVGNVGATTGHLLVGPSRASFSLDGGRTARLMERAPDRVAASSASSAPPAADEAPALAPAPASDQPGERPRAFPDDHAAHPADGALVARSSPAPHALARAADDAAPSGGPAAAAPEPPRLTAAAVRARLDRCFKQSSEGDSAAVRVSVSSTLHILLNADGTVRAARFTTPLKPELTACAGTAIAGRFADGLDHVDIPVTFQP